jgi:membrane associated rhomboid family serine protease
MPIDSVSIGLIIVTVFTSVLAWTAWPRLMDDGMLRPYFVFRENRWHQMLTSAFLHADVGHLALNMLTLFFFGPHLEQTIGRVHFLVLYLSAAVFANVPTLFRQRNKINYASLGASGAVEGVLFSFILFYPLEKIYLFFIPIGIPAWLFGFLFLGYSVWESGRGGGRINHDAHIGGAFWGLLYTLVFVPHAVEHVATLLSYFISR